MEEALLLRLMIYDLHILNVKIKDYLSAHVQNLLEIHLNYWITSD